MTGHFLIFAAVIGLTASQLTPAEMNNMITMMRQLSVYLANRGSKTGATPGMKQVVLGSTMPQKSTTSQSSSAATSSKSLSSPAAKSSTAKSKTMTQKEYMAALLPYLISMRNAQMRSRMAGGSGGMFGSPAMTNLMLMRMMDMDITPTRALLAGRMGMGFGRSLGALHFSNMMN